MGAKLEVGVTCDMCGTIFEDELSYEAHVRLVPEKGKPLSWDRTRCMTGVELAQSMIFSRSWLWMVPGEWRHWIRVAVQNNMELTWWGKRGCRTAKV